MSLTDRCTEAADEHGLDPAPAPAPRGERSELRLSLPLRHGGTAEVTLRYELVGEGDRMLLVAGGISAARHVVASAEFPEPGWWQGQARSFDPSHHRLLAIDWVGADGAIDRPIDPADQAEAIARLLDHLGIAHAAGFIGASYGGMIALHLAARYPRRCGAILVLSASACAHPYSSALRSVQRRALALGESAGRPEAGIALARALAMVTYRAPEEFAERFEDPRIVGNRVRVGADDYLDHHGLRHGERMSATAYRRLSESIDLHNVEPATIEVPATFVAVDSDALVPAGDIEALAAATPDARFRPIHSKFGHDAFLKEEVQVGVIITEFLQSLESKP